MMLRGVLPQTVQSAGNFSIQLVLEPAVLSFADSTQLLHDILMHASSSIVLLTTMTAQNSLAKMLMFMS
jgi:hypothetical protein